MIDSIVTVLVGILCIVLGASHMRGNLSTLHSYHRHRVSEADRLPFGRAIGRGTVILGGGLVLFGILTALDRYTKASLVALSYGVFISGLVVGLVLIVYALIRYNKGIF
jgi:hypothetical protein